MKSKKLKLMVFAIFFMNSTMAFTSTHQKYSNDIFNALTGALNETFSKIQKEEEIVENHEVIRAYLSNEKGEIVCGASPRGLTPSFMKISEAGYERKHVGHLPECNPEQRVQIQNQAQYASFGNYGESKEAEVILMTYATYFAITCAVGAVVGIASDLTDGTAINELILIQGDGEVGKDVFKTSLMVGGLFGPVYSAGINAITGGIQLINIETEETDEWWTPLKTVARAVAGAVAGAALSLGVGPVVMCGNAVYLVKGAVKGLIFP